MAAGGVRLDLQVGLDLAYLRSQLAGLSTLAQKTPFTIKAEIKTEDLQKQLRAASKEVRLKINDTSVIAATKNVESLIKQLDRLKTASAAASVSAGAASGRAASAGPARTFRQVVSDIDVAQLRSIAKAAAEDGIIKPFEESVLRNKSRLITELNKAANDTGQGFINGLENQKSALAKAAGDYANALLAGIKKTLKIASPSKKMEELGEDAGKGFERGFLNSLDDAFDAIERKMRQRGKILDTIARGIFNMLGMDSAAMLQAAREAKALPGVNWASSVPRQAPSIGPSGTGRLLSGAAPALGLPGTAFSSQKRLLGNRLDEELKDILRGAANAFVNTVRAEMNAAVRSVQVRDLGNTLRTALAPSRVAGLLPSAVGRAPSVYASAGMSREERIAQRTAAAYARSARRSVDVMAEGRGDGPSAPYSYAYRSPRPQGAIVPYAPGGGIVPMGGGVGGGGGAGGGGTGAGFFGGMGGPLRRAAGNLNLPGVNAIREFGDEFKYATQQVLLFGTAYKGLAFLTGFPQQVASAVGALQSFDNSLKAISPTAQEVSASNEQILALVEKYNIPLQSARDGFTKLYASMQPAGFNGDEVRALFEGISKAAATYGMSADKVDRVTYAFAQMASKGQVMSEELKGQLGDVLPGAMALFAEAAGFKGPDAISKFSAALEDGAYKGKAMTVLLKNVTAVMNKEFGPGAEGAALTFQGVMNRMQNSMTLLYESFAPVAVGFLNGVVVPLTNGIKQVTDGINAFFTNTDAKTAGGFALSQELDKLRPAFQGIQQNVQQVIPVLQQFGKIALQVAQTLLQIAGNPFVGYLARVYLSVLPLTLAIQALNLRALVPMIASFARAIPAFIAFNAAAIQGATTNKALQMAMYTTGQTAGVTAGQIRTVAIALKAAFASTFVLAVVGGIGMIIEKISSLNAQMERTKQGALNAAQAIRVMSQTEARQAEMQAQGDVKALQNASMQAQVSGPGSTLTRKGFVPLNQQQQEAYARAGLTPVFSIDRKTGKPVQLGRVELLRGAIEARQGVMRETQARQRTVKFQEAQMAAPAPIAAIAQAPGKDAKSKKGPTKSLDDLIGGDIKRRMEQAQAGIGLDVARRMGAAGENEQAQRMVKFYEKYRNIAVELSAVQETISTVDKQRPTLLKLGIDPSEKLADLKSKEKELAFELAEAMQMQYNESAKYYKEQDKLQKNFARELEDIRIANGLIPEEQANQIKLARQYEDIIERYPFLTKEQQNALRTAIYAQAEDTGSLKERIKELKKELTELVKAQSMVKFGAEAIGSSFAQSFKDVISGAQTAQEAMAGFFQRIADSFLDMAAQMIQKWIQMQLLRLADFLVPGLGSVAGAVSGSIVKGMDVPIAQMPAGMQFANGGVAAGGFMPITPFATGGIVTGPTLGLVGEGRFNEAVVPLPDGKSIPVDLGGTGNNISTNIVINVNNGQAQSSSSGGASELGRKVEGAMKQVIVNELRPGGLLAGGRR